MKVLVITEHFTQDPNNGSDAFCSELIQALGTVHSIDVLCKIKDDANMAATYVVDDLTYESPEKLVQFLNEIDLEPYEVIYNLGALSFGCCIVNYLKKRLHRKILVNHFQLLYAPYAKRSKLSDSHQQMFGDNQKEVAQLAKINIFISQDELVLAHKWGFPIKESCTAVIPNGMSMQSARELPTNNDSSNSTVFLLAGRLSDYIKGADIAFRAFERLAREHDDVFLIAIGDSRSYAHILDKTPQGQYELIQWLPRSEMHEAIKKADVVLIPSRYEPFGMMAIEALYYGKPVVANNTGGLGEIIRHQVNGLLNPPENGSLGIYQAVKYLTDRPKLRKEMGIAGHKHVAEQYDIHRVSQLVEAQLYRAQLSIELVEYYASN